MLKLIKFQTWTEYGYQGSNGLAMAEASLAEVGTNWHTVKLAFRGNQIKVFLRREPGNQCQGYRGGSPIRAGGSAPICGRASSPYTMSVGQVIVRTPVLQIPDPQLEAAVRSSLSSTTSNLDLTGLTCLWACNRQITNLDGLEWATNLVSLYLNDNAITDVTPLKDLTRLSALELYGNPIASLTPLAGLPNLSCLVLGQTSGR